MTGTELKVIRTILGWNQRRLSTETGIPYWTLSRIENGHRAGTPEQVRRIKVALGLEKAAKSVA